MTWLALLLKPLVAPLVLFCFFLPARFGAVAVWKWVPEGRVKRALLDKPLERAGWGTVALMFLAMLAFYLCAWYYVR